MTITIDRTIPPTHSRAIGVVRGIIRISQFSRDITLNTLDGTVLTGKIQSSTQNKILRNPQVLTTVADWQCWIRTDSRDITIIPLKFEICDNPSPDVDRFIISGVNLGSRKPGVVCLGINSPNEAVKRFWIKSHGTIPENIIGGIYETECVRKNTRLYIVRSKLVGMTKSRSTNKKPIKHTLNKVAVSI
jgi:hypothetical protein